MEEHKKLKTVTTTIQDFLSSPKRFLSKLLEENLARLTVKLHSRELYIMTKEMHELFIKFEVNKERDIFQEKYRALKERCAKVKDDVKDDVNVSHLTIAQKTLLQLEGKFELFDNMSNKELLTVVKDIQLLKMKKGEKVFGINNTSQEIFYILGGAVSVIINDNEVALLRRNSFFGEMAYITNKPRNATVVIKTETAILLSFKIKEKINHNNSQAFMKLFRNINSMLVKKVEMMNDKFA